MDSHLQGAHSTLTSRIPNRSWRVPLSNLEDHPAFTYHTTVFDPDHAISGTLLTRLASATASTTSQLCQPFVKSGTILDTTNNDSSIALNSILLDSGAQGSNFLARQVYDQLPSDVKHLSCPTNRVVRLGDSRSLAVNLESPLTLAIPDSQGLHHQYLLWYSILEILSHDVIIGLIDLIGPYYDLFKDSVISCRKLATTISIRNEVNSFTFEVNAFTSATDPNMTLSHRITIDRIFAATKTDYLQKKRTCNENRLFVLAHILLSIFLLSKMGPQQKPCQTLLTVLSLLMTVLSLTMTLWLQHSPILSLAT